MDKHERLKNIKSEDQKYLNQYLNNLERQNKSKNTIKSYENDLIQFNEWLNISHQKKIKTVNSTDISVYLNFLSNGGEIGVTPIRTKLLYWTIFFISFGLKQIKRKQKSIKRVRALGVNSKKRHLSCLKNYFEYLKQMNEGKSKRFQTNPVKDKIHAIKLKEIDVEHTSPLLPKHWECINDTLYRIEEKFLANLLYFGGLRLSEAQGLNVEDFDFMTKTINLKRKGGYKHQLKIQNSRKIFEQLDLYLAKKRSISDGALFVGRDGKRANLKTMYNRVMNILKKSGLPSELTPHSFRRACATNLYIETKDLLFVRDYLNHHDAKVTQTYIDSTQLEKSREKIHPDLNFPSMRSTPEKEQPLIHN